MQQGGGAPPATAHMALPPADQSQQMLVEEATPISSRPPAITGTLDELMRLSDAGDEAVLTSGNRWPRQETLALIQIRSDMDAAFRDATVKGPLWEEVSRKLAELGYKRSAKKCKEKFENVHKYYKRTKEGRAGRQDGKSYRFFSQLEALHASTTTANVVSSASQQTAATTNTLDVAPFSIGIPMPVSSIRISSSTSTLLPDFTPTVAPAVSLPQQPPAGISFSSSSDGLSSFASFDDDDDDEEEVAPSNTAGSSRKRKRSSKGDGTRRMIEFFEGLMKHVMEKQEAMQQRFLEAIEKREHDRMIREEAWKRQEMARLAREHELMTQERAISASRDASIIAFLQKLTGQTIQLSSPVTVPAVPQPQTSSAPPPPPPHPGPLTSTVTATLSQQQPQTQPPPQPQPDRVPPQQQSKMHQVHSHDQSSVPSEITMGVPEQEVPSHEMGTEPTSSRWPKAEVLALIQLRSGLESKYLDSGPKGPLWEEISAGMQRMGYKRNAKRCKEKWENINKYFKKVKESNKKRPEDSKTCPYFHELDALYNKKSKPEEAQQHQKESMASDTVIPPLTKPGNSSDAPARMLAQPSGSESQDSKAGDGTQAGSIFGEGNGAAAKKPEDIVKEFIKLHGVQQQQLMVQMEEGDDSDNLGHEDDKGDSDDDYDDDDDDDDDDDRKMAYKIGFQRQNTIASNGGRNGVPSFLAIVQ